MKKHMEKTILEEKLEAELAREEAEAQQEAQPEEAAPNVDVEALTAQLQEAKDQHLRTLAEFDNYRKRIARDHEHTRKTAAQSVMRDLLPVLDNLERACEHATEEAAGLAEGVEMILKQFRETLERHGLQPIPAVGEAFNPHVHEAMMQVQTAEVPADHVVQEFQKGYRLGDFVLRPAKVSVNMGAPENNEEDES